MITFQSSSSAATKRFAKEFAKELAKSGAGKNAAVIALDGELGSGKTTFAQGFAAGLGIKGKTTSPTFILMRVSKIKGGKFIHIDAYRADAADFSKLGFRELAADPKNIILVEWAERLKKILPKGVIKLKFNYGKRENERKIEIGRKIVAL